MTDAAPPDRSDDPLDLVRAAEEAVGVPNAETFDLAGVRATLDRIEAATPGGAALHTQLDAVRKWVGALARPAEHQRLGGEAHLRAHVLTQLRVVRAAIEDYRRSLPDRS